MSPDSSQPLAIMFADVSGSSALYKQAGNRRAKAIIDRALEAMMTLAAQYGGTLVKTIGDEILVRFDSATNACRAAMAIQQHNDGQAEPSLGIRIGLSYGPTLLEHDDVFGEPVNDAACVAHIARGRQVVLTQTLMDELDGDLRERCQLFDHIAIKGASQTTAIFRLRWESNTQSFQATTVLAANELAQRLAKHCLYLSLAGREVALTPDQTPFVIGRDRHKADLHIDTHLASRDHCHIDFRRGKFMLVDHSTNGTYVQSEGRPLLYLRREESPLTGSGKIGVGQQPDQAGDWLIGYSI